MFIRPTDIIVERGKSAKYSSTHTLLQLILHLTELLRLQQVTGLSLIAKTIKIYTTVKHRIGRDKHGYLPWVLWDFPL